MEYFIVVNSKNKIIKAGIPMKIVTHREDGTTITQTNIDEIMESYPVVGTYVNSNIGGGNEILYIYTE